MVIKYGNNNESHTTTNNNKNNEFRINVIKILFKTSSSPSFYIKHHNKIW